MSKSRIDKVSRRVRETLPPIMQVMKGSASEREYLDLSQGVPYFPPPVEAVRSAMEDLSGLHRYGPDGGDAELKEAVAGKLSRDNGVEAGGGMEVMITSGANLGFFNSAAALCDVGDEVVLFDPFYFNHRMTLDILGIRAVHAACDMNHLPDLEALKRAIGPRTKAVVLVSPNNPTGMTCPASLIEELLEFCTERDLFLISDETYEGFEYEGGHFSPASLGGDVPVISLFSLSKSYSLSGWRIGYMVMPGEMYDEFLKVQDTTVICPSRASQRVALHCIRDHPDHLKGYLGDLDRSRKGLIEWLRKRRDVLSCPEPNGAYYALPCVPAADEGTSSMDLVKEILDRTGVLLVPGGPFGADSPPHFRISFGNLEPAAFKEALDTLDRYFDP
ncbi:MAG: pyridoxal phosphate-dependent aminotransferase [Thermoplasmatota archaeon]